MAFFNNLFSGEIAPDYQTENTILFNNDCMKVLKDMKDNSVDLIVTDPPYRITSGGGGKTRNGKKYCSGMLSHLTGDNVKNARTGKLFDYNDIKFNEWLPQLYRILKEDSHCYLFINARNLLELWECAINSNFLFQNLLIWKKRKLLAYTLLHEFLRINLNVKKR